MSQTVNPRLIERGMPDEVDWLSLSVLDLVDAAAERITTLRLEAEDGTTVLVIVVKGADVDAFEAQITRSTNSVKAIQCKAN